MTTVAKLVKRRERIKRSKVPHDWPLPETLMGIELEVESAGSCWPDPTPPEWTNHRDGSLSNGTEFVLDRPLAGDDLRTAISSIFAGAEFSRSMTGSTHIHMDMLEENSTTDVLQVMVLLVYCLESMLFAAGDPAREWCGFANRLQSGPDNILSVVMSDDLHRASDRTVQEFNRNYNRNHSTFGRYYGLNMASLLDYGSLEFRYFPTATSEQEMVKWVELVQLFKKAAIALGNVEGLMRMMESEVTYQAFLNEHFSKFSDLFSYLGSYYEVRSSFHKALLTAKISNPKRRDYDGRKIFASGKFAKFVKSIPEGVVSAIHIMGQNVDHVPTADEVQPEDLLVYNGSIYVWCSQRRRDSFSWVMLPDVPHAMARSMPELARHLEALRSGEIWDNVNLYIRDVILSILDDVSRAQDEAQDDVTAFTTDTFEIEEETEVEEPDDYEDDEGDVE